MDNIAPQTTNLSDVISADHLRALVITSCVNFLQAGYDALTLWLRRLVALCASQTIMDLLLSYTRTLAAA